MIGIAAARLTASRRAFSKEHILESPTRKPCVSERVAQAPASQWFARVVIASPLCLAGRRRASENFVSWWGVTLEPRATMGASGLALGPPKSFGMT